MPLDQDGAARHVRGSERWERYVRVRNLAVAGAAVIAAWAGGTGMAQATDEGYEGDTGSECYDLSLASLGDESLTPISTCEGLPVDCADITLLASEGSDDHVSCTVDITVDVEGDCEDPETFDFTVRGTDLSPETTYVILLSSADLSTVDLEADDPFEGLPLVGFPFVTDADGDVDTTYTANEEEDGFDFPSGAFTLYYLTGSLSAQIPTFGQTDVDACETGTQPGGTTPTTPAPTTPAPTTQAPGTAAPVVVTHPAAAQPAVLANTGTPTASMALLGGGLLVAGAGAMVITRCRRS